jgi:GAF domain-containing protein
MLSNDELIGSLSLARWCIEPFREKEIELVTDFAAQTAIALEITRRERDLQMELARVNRIAAMEQLSSAMPMRSSSRSRRRAITVVRGCAFWNFRDGVMVRLLR